jgi:hypothetical protein
MYQNTILAYFSLFIRCLWLTDSLSPHIFKITLRRVITTELRTGAVYGANSDKIKVGGTLQITTTGQRHVEGIFRGGWKGCSKILNILAKCPETFQGLQVDKLSRKNIRKFGPMK